MQANDVTALLDLFNEGYAEYQRRINELNSMDEVFADLDASNVAQFSDFFNERNRKAIEANLLVDELNELRDEYNNLTQKESA